jgi:hypothetical protein
MVFGKTFIQLILASFFLTIFSNCSETITVTPAVIPLPSPTAPTVNGFSYVRGKAEFDMISTPSASSKLQLIKKSYASGDCQHGQCTDFSDFTITNVENTLFSLTQSGQSMTRSTQSYDLGVLVSLTIGSLFDNNLFACSGFKCVSALIKIYTTNQNGKELGSGLYNYATAHSINLFIKGPLLKIPTAIPFLQQNGLVLNNIPITASTQVISLIGGDFLSDVYPLMADFTTAEAGTYQAHIVVEYDLTGVPPPKNQLLNTNFSIGLSSVYGIGLSSTLVSTGGDLSMPTTGSYNSVFSAGLDTVSCAIKSDQLATCWGSDKVGATNTVPALTQFQSIAINGYGWGICGLQTNGSLNCWHNDYADSSDPQLGKIGDYTTPIGTNYSSIAANVGSMSSWCAVTNTGAVTCWGDSYFGGTNGVIQNLPSVSQVIVDNSAICGLGLDGVISCIGSSLSGVTSPPTGTFSQIAGADSIMCGVRSNGSLKCWGLSSGPNGIIGNEPTGYYLKVMVSGPSSACAIQSNNQVVCWGNIATQPQFQ